MLFYFVLFFRFKLPLKVSIEFLLLLNCHSYTLCFFFCLISFHFVDSLISLLIIIWFVCPQETTKFHSLARCNHICSYFCFGLSSKIRIRTHFLSSFVLCVRHSPYICLCVVWVLLTIWFSFLIFEVIFIVRLSGNRM